MLLHMIYCKQSQIEGLPYEAFVANIKVVDGVNNMGELVGMIHSRINYFLIRSVRVRIFRGELGNESMDENNVVSQPAVENDTTLNTIMEIYQ